MMSEVPGLKAEPVDSSDTDEEYWLDPNNTSTNDGTNLKYSSVSSGTQAVLGALVKIENTHIQIDNEQELPSHIDQQDVHVKAESKPVEKKASKEIDAQFGNLTCQFCHLIFTNVEEKGKHERSCQSLKVNESDTKRTVNEADRAKAVKPKLRTPKKSSPSKRKKRKSVDFACDQCGKKYTSAPGLRYHTQTVHKDKSKPTSSDDFPPKDTEEHSEVIPNDTQDNSIDVTNGHDEKSKSVQSKSEENNEKASNDSKEEDDSKSEENLECKRVKKSVGKKEPKKSHKKGASQSELTCNDCGKVYTSAPGLRYHIKVEHGPEESRTCKKCGDVLLSVQELKKHKAEVHNDGFYTPPGLYRITKNDLTCKECGKKYLSAPGLRYHLKTSHGNASQTHTCKDCNETFETKELLKTHMKETNHGRGDPVICKECGKEYTTPEGLRYHMKKFHADDLEPLEDRRCKVCNKLFKTSQECKIHVATEHENVGNSLVVTCDLCNREFEGVHLLKHHMKTEHADSLVTASEKIECQICNKVYTCKGGLKHHMAVVHQIGTPAKRSNKTYRCEECNRDFTRSDHYKDHMDTHSGNTYTCHICNKSLTTKSAWSRHVILHDEDKRASIRALRRMRYRARVKLPAKKLPCPMCGKQYVTKSALKTHLLWHSGERPHACEVCGRTYLTVSHLHIHMQVHATHRKYTCNTCGKAFKQSATLRAHMVVHLSREDWNVICEICSARFADMSRLRHHMKAHSDHRPFQCPHCSQTFKTKAALNYHVKRHTGERPHICSYCGKGFISKHRLNVHEEDQHSDNPTYQCPHCDQVFTSRKGRRLHKKAEHPDKAVHRIIAKRQVDRIALIKKQEIRKNSRLDSNKARIYTTKKEHWTRLAVRKTCQLCPRNFHYQEEWDSHVDLHTSGEGETCQLCDKVFSQDKLKIHMKNHSSGEHTCTVCNKTFQHKHTLKRHLYQHTGETPYPCHYCPLRFKHTGQRVRHVAKMHTEMRQSKIYLDRAKKLAAARNISIIPDPDNHAYLQKSELDLDMFLN